MKLKKYIFGVALGATALTTRISQTTKEELPPTSLISTRFVRSFLAMTSTTTHSTTLIRSKSGQPWAEPTADVMPT